MKQQDRGLWASKAGFVLAAAGSAVGLGNIWRFPYITGENGGGLFVLLYLVCIALVGLPIMVGEILLGRHTQRSAVGAFRKLSAGPWTSIGWLGVVGAFAILSFYSIVAGWSLHYMVLSATGGLPTGGATDAAAFFGSVQQSAGTNLFWHTAFMVLTTLVVLGGVQKGLERWSRILMPALLLMLLALLGRAFTMSGFGEGFSFVFGLHADKLTGAGILEAMGHSFFTLSLGMGAMITYGSYLDRRSDIVANSLAVTVLDTLIALLACLVLFPIIFTAGMEPAQGPGLVFINLPIAFSQMPAGNFLATGFFALLVFAALTSSISMLEVATAYFIDEKGWTRRKATLVTAGSIFLLGIPCALTWSSSLFGRPLILGRAWFDVIADGTSNLLLPIGGLGIALFVGWRLDEGTRREEFAAAGRWGMLYAGWLTVMRFVVPLAVVAVFLHAVGVL